MNDVFEIEGYCLNNGEIFADVKLADIPLYVNIPEWIEERNVYDIFTKKLIGTIKPQKFNGLTYRIINFDEDYAEIKTATYKECLVRITEATKITNYPVYERGEY